MKISALIAALAVGTAFSSIALAQAPAGSTGECKDGTYTSAEHKQGACKGHGGVKSWYSESEKKSSKSETKSEAKSQTTAAPATTTAPAMAPAKPATETKSASKSSSNMRAEAAPGGGAGKVWVNTSSKVYHCQGDEWYGKTKQGEYMTEAEAKAKGARASHGKACS